MQKITLKELANITNISTNTLRTWLSSYKFFKFRLAHDYKYSHEFIKTFIKFLELKRNYKAIKNIKMHEVLID